jgi:hypothetical protein
MIHVAVADSVLGSIQVAVLAAGMLALLYT